jgi:hypothetical protein
VLDITFYTQDREAADYLDVSEDFYEWLAKSPFSRITPAEVQEMTVDGEPIHVPIILLEGISRHRFSDFLRDAIVQESDEVLQHTHADFTKDDYQTLTLRLRELQSLRKCIENEQY